VQRTLARQGTVTLYRPSNATVAFRPESAIDVINGA
jgi:hypothetical protein